MELLQSTPLVSTCNSSSLSEKLDLQSCGHLPNFPEIFKQYEKHHEQIFNDTSSLANRSIAEIQQSMELEHMKFQEEISGIGNEAVFKVVLPLFVASGNLIRRACSEDEKFIFRRTREATDFLFPSPLDADSLKLTLRNRGHFYSQEKNVFILVMESKNINEIIGYAAYSIYNENKDDLLAEIDCLEIKESEKGNGFGTLLLETILLELSEKKIQEIKLIPTPEGAPLYVNTGFMPTACKLANAYNEWKKLETHKQIKLCGKSFYIYLNLNNYNTENMDDKKNNK